MLWSIVDSGDLAFLRIAARRWAKEHPENKNQKHVLKAVEDCYPPDHEWVHDNDERGKKEDAS